MVQSYKIILDTASTRRVIVALADETQDQYLGS